MAKRYTAVNIKHLNWYEAIRLRPGMYVRHLNHNGFLYLIQEICIAAFSSFHPKEITLEINPDSSGKLISHHIKKPLIDYWCGLDMVPGFLFEFSVLNALSSDFMAEIYDNNQNVLSKQCFQYGVLQKGVPLSSKYIDSTLTFTFSLDLEIWGQDFSWDITQIQNQFNQFAFLYKDKTLHLKNNTLENKTSLSYHYKNGLKDKIEIEHTLKNPIVYINHQFDDFNMELAFTIQDVNSNRQGYLKSYVCSRTTSGHGSHVNGVLKGIHKGIHQIVKSQFPKEKLKISNKVLKQYLIVEVNTTLKHAHFYGATQYKLRNPELVNPIAHLVSTALIKQFQTDLSFGKRILDLFKLNIE